MTTTPPLWMQKADPGDTDIEYSARQFRQLITAAFPDEGVLAAPPGGFAVTERAAGANFDLEVAPGCAIVEGDDATDQGSYLVVSDATETVTIAAAPGSNSRIDLVVLQIEDDQVDASGSSRWIIDVIEGTADPVPTVPALPNSAIKLAQVLVASDAVSITNSVITDLRTVLASAEGLPIKQTVRAATTGAGTLASSFEAGDTLDGVTLATGDRILVKNQATASENGIYVVNKTGAPTRAYDADTSAKVKPNTLVGVSEGTANADKWFQLTSNAPIVLGTTNLTWAEFGGG
jgi:hypothetical protein